MPRVRPAAAAASPPDPSAGALNPATPGMADAAEAAMKLLVDRDPTSLEVRCTIALWSAGRFHGLSGCGFALRKVDEYGEVVDSNGFLRNDSSTAGEAGARREGGRARVRCGLGVSYRRFEISMGGSGCSPDSGSHAPERARGRHAIKA